MNFLAKKKRSENIFFCCILAPGSYDVDKADKKIHESSPSYSIGTKHREQKHDDIPGNFHYYFFYLVYYKGSFINNVTLQEVVSGSIKCVTMRQRKKSGLTCCNIISKSKTQ